MALSGTTWLLKERISGPVEDILIESNNISQYKEIKAINKNEDFGNFYVMGTADILFQGSNGYVQPCITGEWQDPDYRLIRFGDLSTASLSPDEASIETWLASNATQVTSLLEGTTWLMNEQLTAPSVYLLMQTSNMKFIHFMRAVKKKSYGKLSMGTNGYLVYATSTDTIGITDAYVNGAWTDQDLRIISFGDMSDVTYTPDELTIYQWLNANATRLSSFMITEADMKAIANAIRSKTGETAPLVFYGGFTDAINGITTLAEGTATATATTSDIKYGKSAYVKGERVTGTYRPTATIVSGGSKTVRLTVPANTYYSGSVVCEHEKPADEVWPSSLGATFTTSNMSGASVHLDTNASRIQVVSGNTFTLRSSGQVTITYTPTYSVIVT